MDRIGVLLALVLIVIPVLVATRKGREPLPWLVYSAYLLPVAFIHALVLRKAETGQVKARGPVASFLTGFLGAMLIDGAYKAVFMVAAGLQEGIRISGSIPHVWVRGSLVVIAGFAGAVLGWKARRVEAVGFALAAALYAVGMVLALVLYP